MPLHSEGKIIQTGGGCPPCLQHPGDHVDEGRLLVLDGYLSQITALSFPQFHGYFRASKLHKSVPESSPETARAEGDQLPWAETSCFTVTVGFVIGRLPMDSKAM